MISYVRPFNWASPSMQTARTGEYYSLGKTPASVAEAISASPRAPLLSTSAAVRVAPVGGVYAVTNSTSEITLFASVSIALKSAAKLAVANCIEASMAIYSFMVILMYINPGLSSEPEETAASAFNMKDAEAL